MKRSRWIVAATAAAIVACTLAWAVYSRKKPENPKFAKIDEVRNQMLGQISDPGVDLHKREELGRRFDEELARLSEEERDAYMESREEEMEQKMMEQEEKFLEDFFNMSKDQQHAALDKMVEQMQAAASNQNNLVNFQSSGGGKRNASGSKPQSFGRDENGKSERVERMKRDLNRSRPQTRARNDEFARMMSERMRPR